MATGVVARRFDLGQDEHRICVPAPADPSTGTTFGDTLVRHSAPGPVTITDVSLVAATDLELREAVLVPVFSGQDDLVGMRHMSNLGEMPPGWQGRIDAVDAVVATGEDWNLVLVVGGPEEGTGSAKAARITYRDQDGRLRWQDTVTSMYVTTRACPDVLAGTGG
jgi:hypothetical protein